MKLSEVFEAMALGRRQLAISAVLADPESKDAVIHWAKAEAYDQAATTVRAFEFTPAVVTTAMAFEFTAAVV